MKVHYPKLYNMAHLLALNVLLLSKDLTIILLFIIGMPNRSCIYSSGGRTNVLYATSLVCLSGDRSGAE